MPDIGEGEEANGSSLRGSPLKVLPSEKKLTLLPEINGPVKSIKQLLLQDLEADGVIKRNIPFSTTRRRKQSFQIQSGVGFENSYATLGRRASNDVLPFLQASPSVSSIQTARTLMNLDNTTSADKARKMGSLRVDSSTQLHAHKARNNQISDYQKNLVVGNPAID